VGGPDIEEPLAEPRSWSAFFGDPLRELLGNVRPLQPIPQQGHWELTWPLYFAVTSSDGWHFRIGFRWDDVDGYYDLSVSIKHHG